MSDSFCVCITSQKDIMVWGYRLGLPYLARLLGRFSSVC